ncbi:MAG TPA: endolytic transglycosylase MltG [Steroidobacteraceae bacterium]|nr:endolytic transglycosylase MltG [Steroidobacteraceae bacterium]
MKRVVTVALAILVVIALAAYRWVDHYLHAPLQLAQPAVISVPAGSSFSTVARDLSRQGILKFPQLLSAYARARGKASRIRAGEYQIGRDQTPAGLIEQLVRGDVLLREVTIVEGWTVRDMLTAMGRNPFLSHTLDGAGAADGLMERLGEAGKHPEGQFFPDTYRFARGTSDLEVLRKAHEAMQTRLAAAWSTHAATVPFDDPYQALILASMVEKESALPAERQRIAGVFVRRLRLGMRLQSDPTVIYGLGESYTGDIRTRDLHADTPYNTYTRAGLPPSPIALPGEGSLQAATHPDDSGALFFVATGEPDGSHYFSATLAEHDAAVRRYLARIRNRSATP